MHQHHRSDARILIYRMTRQAVAIAAALFIIKFALVDIVAVKSDSMAPAIVRGDHLLVFRLPCLPLLRALGGPGRGGIILFNAPSGGYRGCLRVGGLSGDTVTTDNGVFRNSRAPGLRLPEVRGEGGGIVPADFSPRDFTPALRVPGPGDQLVLDSLDLYRFFCALSVIRQENPSGAIALKPTLVMDGKSTNDYFISDFALYRGQIDSVPPKLRYDWFFWNRLRRSVELTNDGHPVRLTFAIEKNGVRLTRYTVRKRYMFLVADNWARGLDSRYFGPVATNVIFARPICVLWSFRHETKRTMIKIGRILKII